MPRPRTVYRRGLTFPLAALLFACTPVKFPDFKMPRNIEDVRGRLLPQLEGHPVADARAFLAAHAWACDAPLPSATEAHAHVCRAIAQDAGWSRWTLTLLERNGRVADLQVR